MRLTHTNTVMEVTITSSIKLSCRAGMVQSVQ